LRPPKISHLDITTPFQIPDSNFDYTQVTKPSSLCSLSRSQKPVLLLGRCSICIAYARCILTLTSSLTANPSTSPRHNIGPLQKQGHDACVSSRVLVLLITTSLFVGCSCEDILSLVIHPMLVECWSNNKSQGCALVTDELDSSSRIHTHYRAKFNNLPLFRGWELGLQCATAHYHTGNQ
jgi:hypothetical protein